MLVRLDEAVPTVVLRQQSAVGRRSKTDRKTATAQEVEFFDLRQTLMKIAEIGLVRFAMR
ncbi:UNVERIFIED_CONTAM: hypothetical protein Sradi_0948900 [Sesamum radiatum]|uniref:Uncharacterized protein n=1 Tax=Sesamum radiatum TaxID=300843 RepID=A0AAW2IR49_SESRA